MICLNNLWDYVHVFVKNNKNNNSSSSLLMVEYTIQ